MSLLSGFWHDAWFFTWELFKFTTLFYSVWLPGFLVSALLICRFRHQLWIRAVKPVQGIQGALRSLALGVLGSAGRKTSLEAMIYLVNRGLSPSQGLVFLIASRNMTIHFWAIFALSLGAEFAIGQVLGALVMIGAVMLGFHWLNIKWERKAISEKSQEDLSWEFPKFFSWRAVLLSLSGWLAILKFIGKEIWRLAPSLAVGIALGGIILAAGLRSWWLALADVFGRATLSSDLANAVLGAALSPLASLSPVGNLPVIHALFKTDGLGYPGIISFCLASAIHRSDIKTYLKTFGRRRGCALVSLLYGAAVLGGLSSTWIYAAFGFRPALPPVRLAGKLARDILGLFGF